MIKRLWHKIIGCPNPPPILEAVIGKIGDINIWEQRRCTCGRRTHWRRDSAGEPFYLWMMPVDSYVLPSCDNIPISADLRNL